MLHLGQFPVKSIEPQNVSKIIILLTLTNFPHRAVIQISYVFSILSTFFSKNCSKSLDLDSYLGENALILE